MNDYVNETAGDYFDELAVVLAGAGMPADRVRAMLDDLAGYLAESGGGDPEEEFGPAAELARELAVTSAPPAADARTWRWTADLFHDVKTLNEYGAQGWEVDGVDGKGLFVSVRDPENPQQWEYRRELVSPGRRQSVLDLLTPDGWEPCGRWVCFEYFKRPKAASLGPAAELTAPPRPPGRNIFLSPKFYAFIAGLLALTAGALVLMFQVVGVEFDPIDESLDTILGALTGMAVVALAALAALWLVTRRRDRNR
ncbi:hypothetical protein ABZ260_00975 [Streptosporangium sp. NPDC006013]|uniref:hypothetical protein n=1 Tax=Streptosporangium sp. NPDC006013 TaxID=3155596 RepID=UPI0033B37EA9